MSELVVWVIYDNPTDYPGRYVVRAQRASAAGVVVDPWPAAVVGSLDEARAAVPHGLYCLPASPDDDRTIVETWF